MKKNIKKFINCCVLLLMVTFAANAQFTINSTSVPSVSPFLNQIFSQTGGGVHVRLNYQKVDPTLSGTQSNFTVRVSGKLECLSPSQFTIELKDNDQLGLFIDMMSGSQRPLNKLELEKAFGNFDVANLFYSGIPPLGPNDRLPDGVYRICFTAKARKYNSYTCCIDDVDCTCPNRCGCSQDQNYTDIGNSCANFTIITCSQPQNGMLLNTIVTPPINPIISQSISGGSVKSNLQFTNPPTCSTQVRLYGKIQRISPSPFTIELDPNYQQQTPITINPGITQLTASQLMGAFSNFNENNLVVSGVNLASIKDANNRIKLPDGDYRICFYAKYVSGVNASDNNLGCGSFKICNKAGGAPQFIQPVTNANINSEVSVIQPVSPVIFSWTPPQSTCGLPSTGYTYDLEIWELYPNQTVTDAINNPYVFRKTSLPSTTFPLDLNLNKDVLKLGKKYAIRVRAVSINLNSPVEIDNDGYSRVEAFQFGGNPNPPIVVTDRHDYFIEFKERKSNYWDDVYSAYQQRRQRDTLVPTKEYIAFALTRNGIAYSLDAIELFLTLNPELASIKKVNISYNPILPVFPRVSVNDQRDFDKEHAADLEPDKFEENKFLKYLDTLTNYRQKIPDNGVKLINGLVNHLNNSKMQVSSVDRVTVSFINSALAELVYQLRLYSRNPNTNQYNQLQKLATTIRELTAESLNSTSFFYQWPEKIRSSFSSYQSGPSENISGLSAIDSLQGGNEMESLEYLTAIVVKQLLPFDVIVWRTGTVAPYKPVLDAPDLKATFRIYYTLSNLYNHKNPEVNAKTGSRLASTIQVSLPSNSIFSFWTLNMVNHKVTTAEDVDLREVLKNSVKKEPRLKKPSIVIKVD